jgi:hypothetical protein
VPSRYSRNIPSCTKIPATERLLTSNTRTEPSDFTWWLHRCWVLPVTRCHCVVCRFAPSVSCDCSESAAV